MKLSYVFIFSLVFLISCSDNTQSNSVSASDFDLTTAEGTCRYAMRLAESEEDADPDFVRSITDMTCTTGDATREQWQCVIDKVGEGDTFSNADLDCFDVN